MNTVTIEYDHEKMRVTLKDPDTTESLLNLFTAAINQTVANCIVGVLEEDPKASEEGLRRALYDNLNALFTASLELTNPAPALTLTEAAILLAENQIMEEATKAGLSLEEYIPHANKSAEEKLLLFKRNNEATKRHLRLTFPTPNTKVRS